jgi:methyltransferase family protein
VLRYLRISLFYRLVGVISPETRRKRMQTMMNIFGLQSWSKVIDLGGVSEIWNSVEVPLDITIVNLPGIYKGEDIESHHRFTYVEGDATSLADFADMSFTFVFSNSVIEHVGDVSKQKMFAHEVQRLAPSYYVQTPSIWFPLEAHTGLLFWWFLPGWIKSRLHRRWARILPAWNEMILGTVVIGKRALRSYFPGGSIKTERVLGLPKSYCIYRKGA